MDGNWARDSSQQDRRGTGQRDSSDSAGEHSRKNIFKISAESSSSGDDSSENELPSSRKENAVAPMEVSK